jgi:CRISPR-associated protein Csd2
VNSLSQKIDFAVILRVCHANPNGDPLNGNRPRTDYAGLGEITDVCLKRKMRDRIAELKDGSNAPRYTIFVQSDDRKTDHARSLKERAESATLGLGPAAFQFGKANKQKKGRQGKPEIAAAESAPERAPKEQTARLACEKWFDVRAFGQLFAWEKSSGSGGGDGSEDGEAEGKQSASDNGKGGGISIPVRGPVTVQSAFSIEPVDVTSTQITKSVSGEGDGTKRSSDTMGMKHRVDNAVYVFFGSMNPQLAERTGFSDEDAAAIKTVLPKLFENDASSARPEGSMKICNVFWWKHNCKAGQYSSAKVHGTLKVKGDGSYGLDNLPGLTAEEIDGF